MRNPRDRPTGSRHILYRAASGEADAGMRLISGATFFRRTRQLCRVILINPFDEGRAQGFLASGFSGILLLVSFMRRGLVRLVRRQAPDGGQS